MPRLIRDFQAAHAEVPHKAGKPPGIEMKIDGLQLFNDRVRPGLPAVFLLLGQANFFAEVTFAASLRKLLKGNNPA